MPAVPTIADVAGGRTLGQATRYRIRPPGCPGRLGAVRLAGPYGDSVDTFHEQVLRQLPPDPRMGGGLVSLGIGTGRWSHSSAGFNGFAPAPAGCLE